MLILPGRASLRQIVMAWAGSQPQAGLAKPEDDGPCAAGRWRRHRSRSVAPGCRAGRRRNPPGDAVLLRTGWLEAHAAAGQADVTTEPELDVAAALVLFMAAASPIVGATGSPLTPVAVL